MTTAKVSDRGRITLPLFVRRVLGVERGDEVKFVRTAPHTFQMQSPGGMDSKIYLEAVTTDQLMRGMQRAMHEESEQHPARPCRSA